MEKLITIKELLTIAEKKLKEESLYTIVDQERDFFLNIYSSYEDTLEDVARACKLYNLELDHIDADDFFEAFHDVFYNIAWEKIEKNKGDNKGLFLFCLEVNEDNEDIEELRDIPLLKPLAENLTKKEVFRLLASGDLTIDADDFLKKYSPEYHKKFYELTDGTINDIPLKYYDELIEYVEEIADEFLEDEEDFELFTDSSSSTETFYFKLTDLNKDRVYNYRFSLHSKKFFDEVHFYNFDDFINQIFYFVNDLEYINKKRFKKYYDMIVNKSDELEEKVKNFQKMYL